MNIYLNSSSETIYIKNFMPINESEIMTKISDENSNSLVQINPFQYYSHIPVDEDGEIFVSYELQDIVDKINAVIKERTQSISFMSMAAFIDQYPKYFQEIDVELSRIVNLLQTDEFLNLNEVEIQGYLLCDIGCFKDWQVFSRETLLAKDARQKIESAFIRNAENKFPSDIVKRINADLITASIEEIEELISHREDDFFTASTDFHQKLLNIYHRNKFFAFRQQYLFRVIINGFVSPIIEIHRNSQEIKYFIAKGSEFKEFLQNLYSPDNRIG